MRDLSIVPLFFDFFVGVVFSFLSSLTLAEKSANIVSMSEL